jgi:UDP-N-acetylmuramoyl-L-alanyl-D-glutamate--2,6-diaminopimelate ligase
MRLNLLLDSIPDANIIDAPDISISDVVHDSRQVTPGSIFVAMPSVHDSTDVGGLQYVDQAIKNGAVAVVTESGHTWPEVVTVRVPDARAALADLATCFYDHPSRSLQLFAVTGTDGKTTTTYFLEQMLAAAGLRTGLIGTVEIKIADVRERNLDRMTTPESSDLQRILSRMVDDGVSHAVVEASSHALALQRLRGCSFVACALTNIAADHVEFHGSWDAYFMSKAALFTDAGAEAAAILNRDDAHFERLEKLIGSGITTYGFDERADVRALHPMQDVRGTQITVQASGHRESALVPVPGIFNVSNALAAISLALVAGLSLEQAATTLSTSQPPPGRLERIFLGQPFEVVVDYAHTMNAYQSVLPALRAETEPRGQLIVVFGAAGDRDRAKRPMLAREARKHAGFLVVTNEDPYSERPEAIIDEVASGLPADEEGIRWMRASDRAAAIRIALERARPGDTVVMLGKGHEASMVVGSEKLPHSDAEIARRILKQQV